MDSDYLKYVDSLDAAGLEQLMNAYGEDVWNYALFLTGNEHLADDIVQDVFLRAYRGIAAFRGESSVKTRLFKITQRTAVNYRRSAFARKVLLLDTVRPNRTHRSAEAEFLDRMAADEIWRFILSLPVPFREVLLLDLKHGLTVEEMADIIGVPAGTVKSRLYRARAKVTQRLKEAAVHEQI